MRSFIGKLEKQRFLFVVFAVNFLIAFLSFVYFVIKGNGLFMQAYDFNAQEIPFNMFANQAIKSGDIFWNWNIDIGSDFVETFSFYNLGSPFFWITLLFPSDVFPYLIAWIYMLKYAVAGLFSYIYINRFVKNKNAALIGSILYAFSGFQCCNLLFYHFHDVVAFFPLMLIGLEKLQTENKKGVFALSVFVNALLNYFFFIGEVMFTIVYYIVRFFIAERENTLVNKEWVLRFIKCIGICIVEGILGVCMAGVLFIPSILSVLNNSRVSSHIYGNEALVYNTENVLGIIKGLFFPADVMQGQSAVWSMNWYSVSAYLPMVGMFLVLVHITNEKKDWITNLLKTCFVIALIPLLNNAFVMFTSEYYRRWYYMPVIIMALASAKVIENRTIYVKKLKKAVAVTGVFMIGYIVYMWFYPWEWSAFEESGIYRPLVFSLYCTIGLGGVFLTGVLIKSTKKHFYSCMMSAVIIFCVITTFCNLFLNQKDSSYENSRDMYCDLVLTTKELEKDVLPYRYKFFDSYYNRSMTAGIPGRASFISTVSPFISEFYESLGTNRHVTSPDGPEGTNEVLSVGYYVSNVEYENEPYKVFDNGYQTIYIYKDENAVPIGYTYDTYMTSDEYKTIDVQLRGMAMFKTLIIKDEDEEKVSGILRHYDEQIDGSYDVLNREQIKAEHRLEVSRNFWKNSTGFGSEIKADKDKYAYYSIPYDKNWSATVNGENVEILNINGLMAVPITQGDNEIVFSYKNMELIAGFCITVSGLIFFVVYVFYWLKKQKNGIKLKNGDIG